MDTDRDRYGYGRQDTYGQGYDQDRYGQGYGQGWRGQERYGQGYPQGYGQGYGMGRGEGFGQEYGQGNWGYGQGYGQGWRNQGRQGYYGQGYYGQGGYNPGNWNYGQGGYGQGYYGNQYGMNAPWGEQGRYRGVGPQSYQRSDHRIQEDINDRLTEHPHLDAHDINVSVHNGEATLTGSVNSRQDKRMAEDIADSVSGVRDVHNNLTVQQQQSLLGKIQDALTPGTQSTQQNQPASQRH